MQTVRLGSPYISVLARNHNGCSVGPASCVCIFLFSLTNQMVRQLRMCIIVLQTTQTVCQLCLHIFVLANTLPEQIYCFCLTTDWKSFINYLFRQLCLYIFVLENNPNGLSVAFVYFCSCQHISRTYILFLCNSKLLQQSHLIYFLSTNTQTVCRLHLYIFVLANTLTEPIYCFCVTINCYNSCANIFLFSTNTQTVCWLHLYIFVFVDTLLEPIYHFCVLIN